MRWGVSLVFACALSFGGAAPAEQVPLIGESMVTENVVIENVITDKGQQPRNSVTGRKLHGKFLHITGTCRPANTVSLSNQPTQ